jgi:hypothetical protein
MTPFNFNERPDIVDAKVLLDNGTDISLSQKLQGNRALSQCLFFESVPIPDQELIRRRAFELWRQRGCPLWSAETDWFRAEKEFRRFHIQLRLDYSRKALAGSPFGDPVLDADITVDARVYSVDRKRWHNTVRRFIPGAGQWEYLWEFDQWEFGPIKIHFKLQTTSQRHQLGMSRIIV